MHRPLRQDANSLDEQMLCIRAPHENVALSGGRFANLTGYFANDDEKDLAPGCLRDDLRESVAEKSNGHRQQKRQTGCRDSFEVIRYGR